MADKSLASQLDQLVVIERPIADDSLDGAGSGAWQWVDEVWARVKDVLPSRTERLVAGMTVATRQARVRIRWRDDVSPEMRFVMGDRTMQIVAGPADPEEFRRGEALDFMVEDYKPAGNPA